MAKITHINNVWPIMTTPMRAWGYWIVCSAFFLFSYITRIAPSGLMEQLMLSFSVTAAAIGVLGSVYYIGYLSMQVPTGYLIDKYGTSRTVSIALVICALATIAFSFSSNFSLLIISRMVLGVAATFSFIGAIKLATNWFPPQTLGTVVGLTQATGMLGAAIGSGPVLLLYAKFDWRLVLTSIAVIFLILAFLVRFWVQEGPSKKSSVEQQDNSSAPRLVFKSKQSWINAIYAGLLYAPILTLGEVWGTPFLMQVHHLDKLTAGYAGMWMFVGLTIGGPLGGKLSDIFGRRNIMIISAFLSLISLAAILTMPMSGTTVALMMFIMGLVNAGVVASLTVAGEMLPSFATGLSIAFCNLVSLAVGALMQSIVGFILDLLWSGTMHNGLPVYSSNEYLYGLIALPCMTALAFFLAFFVKETLPAKLRIS